MHSEQNISLGQGPHASLLKTQVQLRPPATYVLLMESWVDFLPSHNRLACLENPSYMKQKKLFQTRGRCRQVEILRFTDKMLPII